MKRKGPVTRLKEQFEEKEGQVTEYKDKYLRAVAELENYRKLMQKEMANHRRLSRISFFNKIIPVLDSFDRALDKAHINTDLEKFYQGIEIIHRQLREALESLGLTEFSGMGEPFDPARHEAVATVDTDEHPENTIVDEVCKGYMVDDQIIKPAKVCVSKRKEGGQEDAKNNRD